MAEKEMEWNIGKSRIKFIGDLTTRTRIRYAKAKRTGDRDDIEKYLTVLKMLYDEIRPYIKNKENVEWELEGLEDEEINGLEDVDRLINVLEEKISSGQVKQPETAQKNFGKIHELDREIQEKRISVGLDIPSKTKLDEESALIDGLR